MAHNTLWQVFGQISALIVVIIVSNPCTVAPCEDGEAGSCFGHCGMSRTLPCSCDITCTVINKCCEDFAEVCPGTHQLSLRKFHHVIGSEVTCTPDNYLAISSCPEHRDKHSAVKEADQGFESSGGFYKRDVLGILNNAPVYDFSTDLLYINPDVHSCFADNYSVSEQFLTKIRVKSVISPFSYLELNEKVADFETFAYFPSSSLMQKTGKFVCINDSLVPSTCKNRSLQEIPEIVAKCEKGPHSYVIDLQTKNLYKNINCLECNIGQQGMPCIYKTWRQNVQRSSIYMFPHISVSATTLHVVHSDSQMFIPWQELVCDLSQQVSDPSQIPCAVEMCGERYELRQDGRCMAHHIVQFGLVDKGYSFSNVELKRFPEMISCFARENLHFSIDRTDVMTHHGYNVEHDFTLHYTRLEVLFPYIMVDTPFGHNFVRGFIKLSAMMKAFLCHHRKRQLEELTERNELNKQQSCFEYNDTGIAAAETGTDIPTMKVRTTVRTINYVSTMKSFEVRGALVSNETVTPCYCVSRGPEECRLMHCVEDALYENDSVLIEEYLNSQCISVFQVNETNNASQVNGVSARVMTTWLNNFTWLLMWIAVANMAM